MTDQERDGIDRESTLCMLIVLLILLLNFTRH